MVAQSTAFGNVLTPQQRSFVIYNAFEKAQFPPISVDPITIKSIEALAPVVEMVRSA